MFTLDTYTSNDLTCSALANPQNSHQWRQLAWMMRDMAHSALRSTTVQTNESACRRAVMPVAAGSLVLGVNCVVIPQVVYGVNVTDHSADDHALALCMLLTVLLC